MRAAFVRPSPRKVGWTCPHPSENDKVKPFLASLLFMRIFTLLQRQFATWVMRFLCARARVRHQLRSDGYKVWLAVSIVVGAAVWFMVTSVSRWEDGTWTGLVVPGAISVLLQVVLVTHRSHRMLRVAKQTAHKNEAYIADLASAEALRARWCA